MSKRPLIPFAFLLFTACSNQTMTASRDSGADAAGASDAGVGSDAALSALTPCGLGMIKPLGACYAVKPSDTGANSSGENADYASDALTPAPGVTPRNQLVVFLNGTGGHPSATANATTNFYNTAASLGYHVLALSYRSSQEVATALCNLSDPCFFPTRQTLILGVAQTGAAAAVQNIRLDEGITDRLFLALRYLAAHDPASNWSQFLSGNNTSAAPDTQLAWPKFVISGHSQGGGHAAAIGKLFPVARVIQLAATCDATDYTTPAKWTNGASGTWASDPSKFYGLAVKTIFSNGTPSGGDTTCSTHAVVWQNLGMMAARGNENASTCGGTINPHEAPIYCQENATAWATGLQ